MLPTPPHCCALHQSVCVYESRRVRELLHRCLCESFLCLAEHLSWRIHFRDAIFLFFLCSSSACRQATSTSVDVGVLPLHSSCTHKTKYCSMRNASTAALTVITTAADAREVLCERFTCRYGNAAATVWKEVFPLEANTHNITLLAWNTVSMWTRGQTPWKK